MRPTRAILEFADPRRDTADEAGLQLGVGFVVTGVAREPLGHARLSLQIIRSTDGAVVWAETVDADGTLASSEDLLLDRATARLVKILGATASGRREVPGSEPPS